MKFHCENFKQTRYMNGETLKKAVSGLPTTVSKTFQLFIKTWLLLAGLIFALDDPAHAQELEWVRQVGKSTGSGIAVDGAGNSYVTGLV